MLKIDLFIPEATIELELSRHPESMNKDDLIWLFGVRIVFLEVASPNKTLITLEEVSMFHFTAELNKVRRQLNSGVLWDYNVEDLEGSFRLNIVKKNGTVLVKEVATNKEFYGEVKDLCNAITEFTEEVIRKSSFYFPQLTNNKVYLNFIEKLVE